MNLREIIQRDRAHEQRAADVARDRREPPAVNQAALNAASMHQQIESLRKHLDGIEFMLRQARDRLDALERQAR